MSNVRERWIDFLATNDSEINLEQFEKIYTTGYVDGLDDGKTEGYITHEIEQKHLYD